MDHLLAPTDGKAIFTDDSRYDETAKELQMACFMGLVSYLADRPEVLRVSPFHQAETLNAVARAVVQSATINLTPLSDAGLDGTGEVVQVGDIFNG